MKKIILASTSPRRKEILENLGLDFTIEASSYEEDMTLNLPPHELAEYLSRGKAEAVAANHTDELVIGADTIVSFDGKVLGKPHTKERAKEMLIMLSGNVNSIITGLTIIDCETKTVSSSSSELKVFIKKMTPQEVDSYVRTGEPIDKAGAYAIQGLGSIFIEKIEGDYFGAVGLPVFNLAQELNKHGIRILQ